MNSCIQKRFKEYINDYHDFMNSFRNELEIGVAKKLWIEPEDEVNADQYIEDKAQRQ